MAIKNVLLLSCLVLLIISGHQATEIPVKYTKYVNCGFNGYKPGGGAKRAGDINTTIANLASKQLASVIAPNAQAETLTKYAKDLGDSFFSVLQDVAPKLGPALGKFGSVAGIVMSQMKPKHQDILDAANTAMGKLNRDVNDKIDGMLGYVDPSVTTNEKKLINRQFQGSFDLWVGCIDEANIEDANECQRDAYADVKALKSQFAVFSTELFAAKHLTGAQVRELEAYLLAIRNYINLQIMMLKPLIEIYENDTSSDGSTYYTKYRRHLRENIDYYTAYINLAVQEIVNFWEGNVPGERPCTSESETRCNDVSKTMEGMSRFKKQQASHFVCSCKIDDVQQMCDLYLSVPTDGNFNKSEYKVFVGEEEEIVKNYGSKLLQKLRAKFEKEAGPVIKEYWDLQVLSFKNVWKDARDFAIGADKADAVSIDDVISKNEKDDKLLTFSPRYKQRKAKAEFVTVSNTYFKEHENADHS